ncbi:cyclic nucleotide-binding domain-containing protein [Aurantiacibacter sp. MUD11]|uniref:Crp/Fnr family transcriptional regulator n=1 Tax=Aurantiacibacter sp. MUD11 TaxID=3003265 RepID=UPI0022AA6397|nr:cyclic nucleotide-binding domain-containing protein [Aurantiacibacter sp. MUD11]WAT18617.1 cyclic nucleotide-binding domain-containing protein [Aurantiacibacter sp. MUD11]
MDGDLNLATIAAITAGVLLVAAVAMASLRWVRILALAAGVAALVYVILVGLGTIGDVLVAAFVIVNAVQLLLLLLRSRRHHLSDEERELLEGVLQVQDPEQQRHLLDLVKWRDAPTDKVLMEQGQSKPPLIYVASGAAAIEHDGKIVGVCGPGDFLGEMSLITGEKASATVRVTNPMRIAQFDRDGLGAMAGSIPELNRAFDAALNRGLAAKILRMNKAAATAS